MKICYLDCASGISGDMTLGALVDAGAPLAQIQAGIASLGLTDCRLQLLEVKKKGFRAAQLVVHSSELGTAHEANHQHEPADAVHEHHDHPHAHDHDHDHEHDDEHHHDHTHHHSDLAPKPQHEHDHQHTPGDAAHAHAHDHGHRHLSDIVKMIDASQLMPRQKELAKRIFTRLGEAEAKVHGISLEKVHFHEVGAVDSIADIVGTAIALDLLGIERVECSPVPTGTGFVEIAHGRCSIPAPATGELLKNVPIVPSSVLAELTTPTGAAIVAALAQRFGPPPAMKIDAIGYGAGQRDLAEQANLLRVLIGESEAEANVEQLVQLETNLDDTPGEHVGYALEQLLAAGALDAWTTAIGMKKNRPGVLLSVLCAPGDVDKLETILLRETTTLGVRRISVARRALPRKLSHIHSRFGKIDGKIATLPDGTRRFSPEYENCRAIALAQQVSLSEVYKAANEAFKG
jgi:uncharacterized protein (TIGR00299 family) protein